MTRLRGLFALSQQMICGEQRPLLIAMSYKSESNLARILAPEDVRPRMYVSIMHVVYEHVSWCREPEPWRKGEPARSLLLPDDPSEPLKVVELCLPFILVEDAEGDYETLDVRRQRLAELSRRYGDAVFMRAKAKRMAKKRRRRRKKKTSD